MELLYPSVRRDVVEPCCGRWAVVVWASERPLTSCREVILPDAETNKGVGGCSTRILDGSDIPFNVVESTRSLVDSPLSAFTYREFKLSKSGVGEKTHSPRRLGHDTKHFKLLSRVSRCLRRLRCFKMKYPLAGVSGGCCVVLDSSVYILQ